MKRWIHANTIIDSNILFEAKQFADNFKGSIVDEINHYIMIPFGKGTTESDIMGKLGLGTWFKENGFNVDLSYSDVEYTTKPTWMNYKGWTQSKGHSAMLRNRLILEATW